MAPSESSILSHFLLPPAPLPQVITLEDFATLFPRQYQSHVQIESIYREYQHQRAIDTDDVKRNIASEVKRGEKYRREVARARRSRDAQAMQGVDISDIRMEAEMFGQSRHHPSDKAHTADSLQTALEIACRDVEAEISALESVTSEKLKNIKTTIGDLSDLRYGKFAKHAGGDADLALDTTESLQRLQGLCNESNNG